MRIGEPREQITELDAYHPRPARRVLADIDRRALRKFTCEADGDAVPSVDSQTGVNGRLRESVAGRVEVDCTGNPNSR